MRATGALALVLALPACALPAEGNAGVIRGRVVDRVTGLPLESANVFLVSTTRGTVTDGEGRFVLVEVPAGFYQLTASRVGYEGEVLPVEVAGGDTIRRILALRPRVLGGPEVEIEAESPAAWRRDFDEFSTRFLGTDRFARECRFLNPEVVGFRRDPASGTFLAASDSILRVRNGALGYLLHIVLRSFRWDSARNAVEYTIFVRFEPLVPASPAESLKWKALRREAYRGSVRHFLRALVSGHLEQEAFFLSNERGESLGKGARKVLLALPGGLWQLATDEVLRIDYAGETEAHRNFIRLAQGLVHLGADGSLLEQQEFLIDPGSWWAEHRLGRMLPVDVVAE